MATSLANSGLFWHTLFGKAADIETLFFARHRQYCGTYFGMVSQNLLATIHRIFNHKKPRNAATNHHAATNALAESAIQATFSMRFSYPVQFTEHAFATSNQHLKVYKASLSNRNRLR